MGAASTVVRRARNLPRWAVARCVDRGLLRGRSDYARFVALGWYRTGSNLLLSLLNSDPAVAAYSELFSPRGVFWGNAVYAPPLADDAARAERAADGAAFLRRRVFRPHPAGVRAVGFKLFYPQVLEKPLPGLTEALRADPALRVLHLRRRNLFRVLVSTRVSKSTGQMAATSEDDVEEAQRGVAAERFEPEECRAFFELLERRAAACEAVFDAARVTSVVYEDLVADRGREMARVRAALGLPAAAATTRLVPQTTRPLAELVSNLDELRAAFAGGPYAAFFEASAS